MQAYMMKKSVGLLLGLATLSLLACPGNEAPGEDAGTKGDAGAGVHQEWASEREGACRVFLKLDDGTFILARVCAPDGGARIGMASQGFYSRQSADTLTLQHALSTCKAVFEPGTSLIAKHESPKLILPLKPNSVALSFQPEGASSSDGGVTPTELGCFESDGGFTPHPWQ